jgi:hypothetical protein
MSAWVLIITLKFLFITEKYVFPTPPPVSEEKCRHDGPILAEWLTQDGVAVEWRCVQVDDSRPA